MYHFPTVSFLPTCYFESTPSPIRQHVYWIPLPPVSIIPSTTPFSALLENLPQRQWFSRFFLSLFGEARQVGDLHADRFLMMEESPSFVDEQTTNNYHRTTEAEPPFFFRKEAEISPELLTFFHLVRPTYIRMGSVCPVLLPTFEDQRYAFHHAYFDYFLSSSLLDCPLRTPVF